MKKKSTIFLFLALSSVFYQSALANSSSNFAAALLTGFVVTKSVDSFVLNSLERAELKEWKDSRSNTTALLGDQCGFYYEARLIGNNSSNSLWLTMNNHATRSAIHPIEIEFKFSNGIERRPDLFRFGKTFFETETLYTAVLPFPQKEDFRGQKSLEVKIPVMAEGKSCEMSLQFNRNPSIPEETQSVVSLTTLEMELFTGTNLISGNTANFSSKENHSGGIGMSVYGPSGGGYYLGLRIYGESDIDSAVRTQEGYGADWRARMTDINFGYGHRFAINKDSNIIGRLGIGFLAFEVVDGNRDRKESFSATMIDAQVGYQYFFKRVKTGAWAGSYYWGLNVIENVIFSGKPPKNGSKYDGNNISAMVVLGVGI